MSTRVTHELKCEQPWFDAVWDGSKTFEVRYNDRDFQPGHHLVLREFCRDELQGGGHYLGRERTWRVTYVLRDGERFGIKAGFVVLGMKPIDIGRTRRVAEDGVGQCMCGYCEYLRRKS